MSSAMADAMVQTLREPRAAARRVLGWRLGWPEILLVLATALAIRLLVATGRAAFLGRMDGRVLVADVQTLEITAILVAQVVISIWLVLVIGRFFGGKGSAVTVAAALGWVDLVAAVLELVTTSIGLVLPGALAMLLMVALVIWYVWAFFSFVAVVHGFPNTTTVLMVGMGITVMIAMGLAVVIVLAGYRLPGAP